MDKLIVSIDRDMQKTGILVWFLPVLIPVLLILFSYVFDVWSWGMMDDATILASGTDIFNRWQQYFPFLVQHGIFRPFFCLHSAVFYSIFSSSVKVFYIFKLFEVFILLVIWGAAGWRVTRRKTSLWLIPTIALSSYYFYDTFFYLSSQEFLGLGAVGLALHCFISAWLRMNCRGFKPKIVPGLFIAGVLCLLLAFGAKETFVSCGLAVGASLFIVSFFNPDKRLQKYLMVYGFGIMVISIAYALGLKIFIQKDYTARYHLGNMAGIGSCLLDWFKKSFLNHLPWLILSAWAWKSRIKHIANNDSGDNRGLFAWAMLSGVFLYLGFLAILLPWNTQSYYASPFGLFFAFTIGMAIVKIVDEWSISKQLMVVILALTLNLSVCYYVLNRERTRHTDTANLLQWMKVHHEQLSNPDKNPPVTTNGIEVGVAIPAYLRRQGVDIPEFSYVKTPAQEGEGVFYLYCPSFGLIPSDQFKKYQMEFYSKNWVLYRKFLK